MPAVKAQEPPTASVRTQIQPRAKRSLLWLSSMFSGSVHDNTKLPILTLGGLGGTLATGRVLDYRDKGDENRKLCSLYLSLMDRMGVKLERFGDADTRLAGL